MRTDELITLLVESPHYEIVGDASKVSISGYRTLYSMTVLEASTPERPLNEEKDASFWVFDEGTDKERVFWAAGVNLHHLTYTPFLDWARSEAAKKTGQTVKSHVLLDVEYIKGDENGKRALFEVLAQKDGLEKVRHVKAYASRDDDGRPIWDKNNPSQGVQFKLIDI